MRPEEKLTWGERLGWLIFSLSMLVALWLVGHVIVEEGNQTDRHLSLLTQLAICFLLVALAVKPKRVPKLQRWLIGSLIAIGLGIALSHIERSFF